MEIPADLMRSVFQYLDPPSLAVLAQTCRSWKVLVYRFSVWSSFLWKPKWNYASLFYRREGARHIGEPHALCFLAWAHRHLLVSESYPQSDLPLSNESDDPAKVVRRAYRRWCDMKKPCIHLAHYHWADVCLLAPRLGRLSSNEVLLLRHQLCEQVGTTKGCELNPYAMWLARQLEDYSNATHRIRDWTTDPVPTGSTPLERVRRLMTERNQALSMELSKQARASIASLTRSKVALRAYSIRAFERADAHERKEQDILWDGAVMRLTGPQKTAAETNAVRL
jgi:hypothetical protein